MAFSMNRTWNEAVAMFRSNFQLLAVVGGVFVLIPSLLMYMALPDLFGALMLAEGDPEAMEEMVLAMLGPLLLWGSIGFLAQMVGYLAMIVLMGADRPTVGEAIVVGLKGLLPVIAATLLFALLYAVLALVFGLLVGGLAAALGDGGAVALSFVLVVGLLVATFYIAIRFVLTMPVIGLERTLNPIGAMLRSWRLTGHAAWRIVGFFALLFVAYMVLSLVFMGIIGGALGALGGGSGAFLIGLLNGVIGALVAMIFSAILVSIYRQLAGPGAREVSEAFE